MSLCTKIEWAKLASQVHKTELPKLNKLKSHVDTTIREASVLPNDLPKIDWQHYRARASDPKVVAELEKLYTAIKLNPPTSKQHKLDELAKARQEHHRLHAKYKEFAKSYVESADEVQQKFVKMIPVKEMSMEDWTLTFPEWSVTLDNPSIDMHYGRTPGLSRAEAAAFESPDPLPWATKQAWIDWEKRKEKYVD